MPQILTSTIHLLYVHAPYLKDVRAAAALRCTTTGILASTHGLSHKDRAILSLILCERWGGEDNIPQIDIDFFRKLQQIVGPTLSWWARFIGQTGKLIAELYPAGIVREDGALVTFESAMRSEPRDREAHARQVWVRCTTLNEGAAGTVHTWARGFRKLGKKKNWIGGVGGWGLEVMIEAVSEDDTR